MRKTQEFVPNLFGQPLLKDLVLLNGNAEFINPFQKVNKGASGFFHCNIISLCLYYSRMPTNLLCALVEANSSTSPSKKTEIFSRIGRVIKSDPQLQTLREDSESRLLCLMWFIRLSLYDFCGRLSAVMVFTGEIYARTFKTG